MIAKFQHTGVQDVGNATVVTFHSQSLDEHNLKPLGRELADLADALVSPTLCLDLAGVEYVSSQWLAGFVELHKQLGRRGQKLTIRNVSGFAYQLFTITRLATLLNVSRREIEAEQLVAVN